MSRPFTHLRQVLLGAACTVALGFGVTEALSQPQPAAPPPVCEYGYRLCKTCTGQWYCAVDTGSCPPCELEARV